MKTENNTTFDYQQAFRSNLGLLTEEQQQVLKAKKVAIAGMGGVGGMHLQTLVRMGFENFHIADFDHFELHNLNRQAGAFIDTIGKPKVEVMRAVALDINPECQITTFEKGVTQDNLDAFLESVDLYIDGLDFFVLDIRAKTFKACRQKNIPAITAGPIGMGTAWLIFDPQGMSFEEYFRLDQAENDNEKAVHFLLGLAPELGQKNHIVDHSCIDFNQKKGPSLSVACQAASAVACSEALKILLKRTPVHYVPWTQQFDMLNNRYRKTYNWMGNNNPLNKLKIRFVLNKLNSSIKYDTITPENRLTDIEKILDFAKWAPSGDNEQPWEIALKSQKEFELDLSNYRPNTYSLLPLPHLLSTGMFLENAQIAANEYGYELKWVSETPNLIKAAIKKNNKTQKNPLFSSIKTRSVNRYRYKNKPLPVNIKTKLNEIFDEDIRFICFESWQEKIKIARLLTKCTRLRLKIPETYTVHRDMIDWSEQDSPNKMPASSLGASKAALMLMKWGLQNEKRYQTLINLPGATLASELELDIIPALFCSAHFVLAFDPEKTPKPSTQDFLRAGEAIQRLWLTLSENNMVMQPWFLPIILAHYHKKEIAFTKTAFGKAMAKKIYDHFSQEILDPHKLKPEHTVFAGRFGYPVKTNIKRSIRKNIEQLITETSGENQK